MRQHLLRRLGCLAIVTSLLPRPALALPADPDGRDPRIEKVLSQISEQRLADILQKLGSFGTRNTLSSTDSPTRGIGAARQWIFDEMKKSSSRLQVSFDTYQPSGYDANLRWKASPGAVGYKVFWREAWTPDWQHEVGVGNVTEFVLPAMSIDDYIFGVAAIGADGNESLVSVYVNPPRR